MPAEERAFWGSTLDWGARRRELQEARRDQVIAFTMPELVDGDSVVGVVPQASLYRFGLRMWRSRAVVLTGEWILIVAWDRKTRRCRALEASWRRDLVAAEFLPSYYGDDVIEDRLSLFGPTGTFHLGTYPSDSAGVSSIRDALRSNEAWRPPDLSSDWSRRASLE